LTLSYNITYFFSIFQMAKRAQIKLIHSKRHFQVDDLEVMQISGPQDEGADLRVEQMTWPQLEVTDPQMRYGKLLHRPTKCRTYIIRTRTIICSKSEFSLAQQEHFSSIILVIYLGDLLAE
jgi:hypothetical protein